MVAHAVHPAGQAHGFADVGGTQRAARVRAIAVQASAFAGALSALLGRLRGGVLRLLLRLRLSHNAVRSSAAICHEVRGKSACVRGVVKDGRRPTRHGFAVSRALSPEGCQRAKERGRQTTAILGNNPAAFRRPRAAAAVPRVQRHRQRAFGPTRRVLAAGLSSLRTSGGCAPKGCGKRRCRRASVPGVATHAQPRSPAPASEASFTSRQTQRKTRLPQPGTGPCPASDAQLMRPA